MEKHHMVCHSAHCDSTGDQRVQPCHSLFFFSFKNQLSNGCCTEGGSGLVWECHISKSLKELFYVVVGFFPRTAPKPFPFRPETLFKWWEMRTGMGNSPCRFHPGSTTSRRFPICHREVTTFPNVTELLQSQILCCRRFSG